MMSLSLIFVFTFNYVSAGHGTTLTYAFILGFILIELLAMIRRRRCAIHPCVALFAMFIIFGAASVLWSVDTELTIVRVKSLCVILVYMLCLLNYLFSDVNPERRMILFLRMIVFSSAFAAIYLILNSPWQTGQRVDGVIGDSNQVSAYFAYSIPVVLYCWSRKYLKAHTVFPYLALVLFAVIINGSRTGLVVAATGVLIYWFVRELQHGVLTFRTLFTFLGLTLAAGLLVVFIMDTNIGYEILGRRIQSLIDILSGQPSVTNENSYFERERLYELAVQIWQSSPIFGTGMDTYAHYAAISIRDTFSHNDYLQILSGVGLIGFAMYYGQHAYLAVKMVKKVRGPALAFSLTLLVQILLFHMYVVFYYQKLEVVFLSALCIVIAHAVARRVEVMAALQEA
ncbi:hypothetical protein BAAA27673_08210 [Bifidobacterium animalis subsp. lactis ATCC 27673]|nr:hypothetical protein BAAA27673_08210 [Bifidobacterium animalis subsp. lactis ATCC 27673]